MESGTSPSAVSYHWSYVFFLCFGLVAAKPSIVGNISMLSFPNPMDSDYYAPHWSQPERSNRPTCVDIPESMSLCQGIGYNQMRLPNLLGHDTISEVVVQAKHWVALLNLECHPDTKLFLCSLFSPVCLDRPIYPCRSLCEAVRTGCVSRMQEYGYPWPDMVKCSKFPVDNDMCISVQTNPTSEDQCGFCKQAPTYENILDNFCRSDFAVKTKLKKIKRSKVTFRKGKVLKLKTGLARRKIRRPVFEASNMNISNCCQNFSTDLSQNYLIMGKKSDNELIPTLVMPWQRKASPFKRATRMFKRFDCSNPSKIISGNVMRDGGVRIRQGGREEIIKAGNGRASKKRGNNGEKRRRKERRKKKGRSNKSRRRNKKST